MFHRRTNRNCLLTFVYLLSCLFFTACNKGFTLKIKDQDVLAFGAQDSCNFITTNVLSNTLRVSWKSSTPATFIITSGVPAEYDESIKTAAAKWNSVIGKTIITIVRNNGFTNPPGNDNVNAIYWMTDWETENASQQARTAVRWDVSKIIDADVRINAKNFQFYKVGDLNSADRVNFDSLILHELGHAAGLTHISDLESVMQVYLKTQTVRTQPGTVDITSMKCEY